MGVILHFPDDLAAARLWACRVGLRVVPDAREPAAQVVRQPLPSHGPFSPFVIRSEVPANDRDGRHS